MKPKPRRTRDPVATRAHLLEVAFDEIYRVGFQGASIDRIIRKSSVTKGAFFHYFPTKFAVGYAIVDEILHDGIVTRWLRPLAAYRNPIKGILQTFRQTMDAWPDENLIRGCPLNNLAQEMSAVDPVFRAKVGAVIALWVDETERYLREGQMKGWIDAKADPRRLAEFIVTLQEGAFGISKVTRDRRLFDSLYSSLRDHLLPVARSPRAGVRR